MVRSYGRGDRLYVQAQQIWLILSAHAVLRGKQKLNGLPKGLLSYGDLAELMGKDSRRAGHTLGRQLGIVGYYCLSRELPPLNVIVVTEREERPGWRVVWTPGSSVKQDQRRVLRHPWFELRPPTIKALKDIYYSDDFVAG